MKPSDAELSNLLAAYIDFDDTQDSYGLELTAAHAKVMGKLVADEILRRAAPASVPAELVVPEDGAYLIHYDDKDRQDEVFAGAGALNGALDRYEQISDNWNARLFVMIDSNCGDEKAVRAAYGREQAQWVPVSERLPELHEPVLISNGADIGHARKRNIGWEIVAGNTKVSESNVTHWMPLPQPPPEGAAK